jgi:hypothetical protein
MNEYTVAQSLTAARAAFAAPVATRFTVLRRRRRILTRAPEGDRSRVAGAFRALANGVDARTAAARTGDFYRSSGFAWARCLG